MKSLSIFSCKIVYILAGVCLVSINATCGNRKTSRSMGSRDTSTTGGNLSQTRCGAALTSIEFCDSLNPPHIILQNNVLRAVIYTPNLRCGYYRGTRFDQSGMIGKVYFGEHTFFGDWQMPHDPMHPEHGIGPAEEFDMKNPPLFSAVDSGDTFIKIGVGKLIKTTDTYFMNTPYPIAEPAMWQISCSTSQWIEFAHTLSSAGGIAFTYTKKVAIDKNKPIITISHSLKNSGPETITTEHYSHNFIRIDDRSIDSSYQCRFSFPLRIEDKLLKKMERYAVITGPVLDITKSLASKTLWATFEDLSHIPDENRFTVINQAAGASISVSGDRAPSKFDFYATTTAICPEPFVTIEVRPGDTGRWKNVLRFQDAQ
ncbi:MAG: hypothetical protein GF350_03945 [Chitinivibrionales bacterium]|nr:hypothetical protein [Chitinivibrionales bacterium]